VIELVELPC